ncbi:MAG: hypothetical protein AAFW89_10840 [Bacteroidota bacterium]
MNIDNRNKILSLVFGIVIIALTYWLYDSIVSPYEEVKAREAMEDRVHDRMFTIRDMLIQYETRYGHFPPTEGGIDSVIQFIQADSIVIALRDTMTTNYTLKNFPDSLSVSPRPPHNPFTYQVNDSSRPPLYLLEDPDSDDTIGSLSRTTMRNAPSWN